MSDVVTKSYSEFAFYSPILDANCLRISVSDGKTGEFFAIVPKPELGKSLSKVREAALNMIESYIDAGYLPGEVKVEPLL